MNVDLFERARSLGEALLKTEEYTRVQAAQAALEADEATMEQVKNYNELTQTIQSGMQNQLLDQAALSGMIARAQAMEEGLQKNSFILELTEAQQGFSGLMQQVNQVIRFIITGEVDEGSSCSGDCSGCSGCNH